MRILNVLLPLLAVLNLSSSSYLYGQENGESDTPSPDFDSELANAGPTVINSYNKNFGVAARAGFIVGTVPGGGIDLFTPLTSLGSSDCNSKVDLFHLTKQRALWKPTQS